MPGMDQFQSIGVAGTESNQGATRMCVQMGVCFSKALHQKPELLEMNNSGDYKRIQDAIDGISKNRAFLYHNIRFCRSVRKGEYGKVRGRDRSPCIMDFGRICEDLEDEWLYCDKKIVLASGMEWNIWRLEEFIEKYQDIPDFKQWLFLFPSLVAEERRVLHKQFGIRAETLPYFSDPFEPEREMVEFIQKHLKGG
ncbi:MAG: hypothetical protein PUB10_04760 [Clostridiales bacterium]|nr:hypothetical protein [Clostridiales bacterium]